MEVNKSKEKNICPVAKKCGSCQFQGVSYEEQIKVKQKMINKLLSPFGTVQPIMAMENPYYYRNKVHHVFSHDRKGNPIAGTYEAKSHRVIPVTDCMIEDRKSQEIIETIRGLLKSFKIKTYDEDTEYGLLRHVLVRRGFSTGEIMVVLVIADPIFPSKNNFVKALRKVHPEITTIILNINDKHTSMVLGEREKVIYGPGFIKDELCGNRYRISAKSFYQINPVQTEKLYQTAIKFADLRKKDTVLDAYCGIGTIGLTAANRVDKVIGVELNPDAVHDAIVNAHENKITNAQFVQGDAGEFMEAMAERGETLNTVFMDPPRSGSSEQFLKSVVKLGPKKIVYVSCGPDTLARDLKFLTTNGYRVIRIQPVDMFPFTEHCESVCLLSKVNIQDGSIR